MGDLPCACRAKDNKLNECPFDHTRICCFGLIAELSLTFLE